MFFFDECASGKSNPFQNGGTSIDILGAFQCQCPGGFIGARCETGTSANLHDSIQRTWQHGEITNDSFRLIEFFCVRSIWRKLFLVDLIPFFSFTRLETRQKQFEITCSDHYHVLSTGAFYVMGIASVVGEAHLRLVHGTIAFSTQKGWGSAPLGNINHLKTNLFSFNR